MKRVDEYPGRQALLVEAAKRGINPLQVRVLLWLIQACPTLTDLPTILKSLQRVLIVADRNWPRLLAKAQLAFLLPLLHNLLKLLESFKIPESPQNGSEQRDWLTDDGNLDRNPLFFALDALPTGNSPHAYRCCLFMAHIFFAQIAVLRRPNLVKGTKLQRRRDSSLPAYEANDFEDPWSELRVPSRHAGLAARDFAEGKPWTRILIRTFALSLPPNEFAEAAPLPVDRAINLGKRRRQLEDRVWDTYNFIRQAYGLKNRHRGHGRKAQEPCNSPAPADTETQSAGVAGGPFSELIDSTGDGATCSAIPDSAAQPPASAPDGKSDPDGVPFKDNAQGGEDDSRGGHGDEENNSGDHHDVGQAGEEQSGHRGAPDKMEGGGPANRKKTAHGARAGGDERNPRKGGDPAGSLRAQAIRAGKGFAFDIDRLTACELIPIDIDARKRAHTLLDELLAENTSARAGMITYPLVQSSLDEAELLVFALVQLWSNSTVKRTKSLQISTLIDFSEYVPLAILMVKDGGGKDAVIRLRARWPKECDWLGPQIQFDRMRTQYPLLPDAAELGPMLWKLAVLQDRFGAWGGSFDVFSKPASHYKAGINQLSIKWDRTGRLTLARLRHALYWAAMSWSGKDVVAASLITGDLKEQARVPMFYPCRRMDSLQAIYKGTVEDLRFRIGQESLFASNPGAKRVPLDFLLVHTRRLVPPSQFEPAPAATLYAGTRSCPTDTDMQRVVHELIDRLSAPWNLWDLKQLVMYTNLYTFYSVWGYFGLSTGCRAILDPYLPLSVVSPLNRSALLDDKREEKERLVWIGEGLYAHMEFYEAYLRATGLCYADRHPCWFLAKDGKPLEVRPGTVEPILHSFLHGFPVNTNRRWMMNALWDSGCPPEIVRMWAGHATAGNALWARGATAPYAQMRATLLAYLSPIIEYLGFVPIPGANTR